MLWLLCWSDTHFVIYNECFDLVKSWAVVKFFPIYQLFYLLLHFAAIVNGVVKAHLKSDL